MKHPAEAVYAHVIDSLSDEEAGALRARGVLFSVVLERLRVELELQVRQSRECPWEH